MELKFRMVAWWVDRWRKSTAYNDMTAEEQGLYRNLLDECWLRGGTIPDDQRILERVSGDHDAWRRSGEKVLRWFEKVDGGYTNETATELMQSHARFKDLQSQRARSKHAGWQPDSVPDGSRNAAGMQPTVSVSGSESVSDKKRTVAKKQPSASPRETWLTVPGEIWKERYRGEPPYGLLSKYLRPVSGAVGPEEMHRRFRHYVEVTDVQLVNLLKFAAAHGTFSCNGLCPGHGVSAANRGAAERTAAANRRMLQRAKAADAERGDQ